MVIKEVDQPPRAKPVESAELAPQLPVWEADLLAIMKALTKQTALLQQLLNKIETKLAK